MLKHHPLLACLTSLLLASPVMAAEPEATTAATQEQTATCLGPFLNEIDFPQAYATCSQIITPYVCGVWVTLPNGFTNPLYPSYMVYWNTYCEWVAGGKQGPAPTPFKQVPPKS